MLARLGNALLALSLIVAFSAGTATPVKATGVTGPIQLGGDDQNDHGGVVTEDLDSDPNTAYTPVSPPATTGGWRYVMVSLKLMLATEQRAGASNSIAVIGTDGSAAYLASDLPGVTADDGGVSCAISSAASQWNDESSDTYCMMEVIKAELDRLNGGTAAPTVTYYETAAEVAAFFDALTAGTTNVAVVYITGDGGPNDLDDGDDRVDNNLLDTTLMEQALMDSATDIATFNVQGGGLLSSGSDHYASWLTVLIPTIGVSEDVRDEYIGMTTDGAALWDGLTDFDISSIWHNHFTGDLGALKVLALGFTEIWIDENGNSIEDGDESRWHDTDADNMIDAGEATPLTWDAGPDAIPGNADDLQTIVIIGGAAGEAAIGGELPETNTNGDASASSALLVAALAAIAGLALRVVARKRLQA